ncbi:O-methyltransferase [Rhizobium halophytocola]|uniref:O-methyltransferase YrrM n=1 Tax=Rhizobium halophytocola TaxID=735519 RepID=A0ABS4E3K8_9HYPH|nr:class I SAM-dependent methyltransferase [Rhizobium halophytocola]MBP1852537.1 putative O-methyltransferase YrrM [Rhizobium halophytocola]
MDARIRAVLDEYHQRMEAERQTGRVEAPGGRDGGHDMRMRAVGPQTGQLINILAKSLSKPVILEIGTSFGYSGVWLAEAARATGGRLITMELHAYKSDFARDMLDKAGLSEHVEFLVDDAEQLIGAMAGKADFVLLDLWKDLYVPCLKAFLPKLAAGAIVVADNMIRPGDGDVLAYQRAVRAIPGMTSVMLPVGQGLEISRYQPA